MKINDRVKIKNTRAHRTGTVIGLWDEDFYILNSKNERILFAVAGGGMIGAAVGVGSGIASGWYALTH